MNLLTPVQGVSDAAAGTVVPRPVICVIEHLHRDRSVADAVRAGRFRHAGVTLDLGTDPDWDRDGLTDDVEWRLEWSKFYYGLDLAHAYRETADAGYLHAWVRLVGSWVRSVPADRDPTEVVARRVQNWVYAWLGFAAAPGFPGLPTDFVAVLHESLAAQLAHLEDNLTAERNHRTLELYALLVGCLALPSLDPSGRRAAATLAGLHANLLTDVWADGVHRECSTHYHMIALRSFLGARQNAGLYGLPVPAGYDGRLAAAARFAMHLHRPDGEIPALSDADNGSYGDVLARAAAVLDRADLRWVATRGAAGRPPIERYVGFPRGGYHVQRSGWGDGETAYGDERFLVLDAGPLGDGGHGHYDLLNVEIFAGGRPLVVDPGRYTYSETPPNWRRWFKGTAAHNTVTVDEKDQTPYRRGKPHGPVATGRLVSRQSGPGLDVICAAATSPAYDAVHVRHVAFVADEYWLVADHLEAATRHDYTQRWHLAPAAAGHSRLEQGHDNTIVTAPGLVLVAPVGHPVSLEPGWVAPQYGAKLPAPVVAAAASDVATADFLTLVAPAPDSGGRAPRLSVLACGAGRVAVRVEGVGRDRTAVDHIAWGPGAAPLRLGPLSAPARLAWLRRSAAGVPVRLAAYEAHDLSWAVAGAPPRVQRRTDGWTVLATAGGGPA